MKEDDDIMCYRSELEAAVKAAVAAEREACAELAREILEQCEAYDFGVPAAIRARGQA